jgi:hypothetical protein
MTSFRLETCPSSSLSDVIALRLGEVLVGFVNVLVLDFFIDEQIKT